MDKKTQRLRRARRTRAHIRDLGMPRLTVHRTPRHIYAQVIDASGTRVVATASTVQRELREAISSTGNVEAASLVGQRIAQKAADAGVTEVAFDRSGFRFHGRVKALADAARDHGLQF